MADTKDETQAAAAARTKAAAATTTTTVVPATPAAAMVAPQPPGIFDELNKLNDATAGTQSNVKYTFGAWARAKGVKLERIRQLVAEKKLDTSQFTGDGPEMTEAEFDEAVEFRLYNTFGELPVQRIHVPAEQARAGTAGLTPEQLIDAQASADRGRRI